MEQSIECDGLALHRPPVCSADSWRPAIPTMLALILQRAGDHGITPNELGLEAVRLRRLTDGYPPAAFHQGCRKGLRHEGGEVVQPLTRDAVACSLAQRALYGPMRTLQTFTTGCAATRTIELYGQLRAPQAPALQFASLLR